MEQSSVKFLSLLDFRTIPIIMLKVKIYRNPTIFDFYQTFLFAKFSACVYIPWSWLDYVRDL